MTTVFFQGQKAVGLLAINFDSFGLDIFQDLFHEIDRDVSLFHQLKGVQVNHALDKIMRFFLHAVGVLQSRFDKFY